MKKYLLLKLIFFTLLVNNICNAQKIDFSKFLPKGYVLLDTIYGDLNKDGSVDCILLIKGTDKENIVQDEYRGELDRNRRGLIVLFNKGDNYKVAITNFGCFSSENEDGGVYSPPELSLYIKKGNLYIHYAHGRYGYWKYTFRFQNSNFELIGYDASDDSGPIVNNETSINFLTKRKQIKENTNKNAEGGDEIFKETWENININKLINLSDIKDFDKLDMSTY